MRNQTFPCPGKEDIPPVEGAFFCPVGSGEGERREGVCEWARADNHVSQATETYHCCCHPTQLLTTHGYTG